MLPEPLDDDRLCELCSSEEARNGRVPDDEVLWRSVRLDTYQGVLRTKDPPVTRPASQYFTDINLEASTDRASIRLEPQFTKVSEDDGILAVTAGLVRRDLDDPEKPFRCSYTEKYEVLQSVRGKDVKTTASRVHGFGSVVVKDPLDSNESHALAYMCPKFVEPKVELIEGAEKPPKSSERKANEKVFDKLREHLARLSRWVIHPGESDSYSATQRTLPGGSSTQMTL